MSGDRTFYPICLFAKTNGLFCLVASQTGNGTGAELVRTLVGVLA
ncbi:hypothetical protein [Gimesia maris]|nr:hypothetical protein [Gimesia maris]